MTDRDALALAAAIRQGDLSARSLLDSTLADISARNPTLNCFTEVTAERARSQAQAVDHAIAVGQDPGPLAGVPF
ncbi:MAG: amidase family protein, partial [Cyanobacteria bacterium J06638_6]